MTLLGISSRCSLLVLTRLGEQDKAHWISWRPFQLIVSRELSRTCSRWTPPFVFPYASASSWLPLIILTIQRDIVALVAYFIAIPAILYRAKRAPGLIPAALHTILQACAFTIRRISADVAVSVNTARGEFAICRRFYLLLPPAAAFSLYIRPGVELADSLSALNDYSHPSITSHLIRSLMLPTSTAEIRTIASMAVLNTIRVFKRFQLSPADIRKFTS